MFMQMNANDFTMSHGVAVLVPSLQNWDHDVLQKPSLLLCPA